MLAHTKNHTIHIVDSRDVGLQALVLLLVFATFFTSVHTEPQSYLVLLDIELILTAAMMEKMTIGFQSTLCKPFFIILNASGYQRNWKRFEPLIPRPPPEPDLDRIHLYTQPCRHAYPRTHTHTYTYKKTNIT